jgi:orotidine-5'-phosphate decarboxylase
MTRQELIAQIQLKKSFLCVGLDTDITKIPNHLLSTEDPVFEFNKAIIDSTKEYCVCYKINTAFYEAQGIKGWISMQKTLDYIPSTIFTIADAKRGDIGNTGEQYAKAFFETMTFDSVTVAPYMGKDSVTPFLNYKNKWAIVLALTSNEGAFDFQTEKIGDEFLYEKVLKKVSGWGTSENTMFVVGATKTQQLNQVRTIVPHHFLLIPGVGAQGGSIQEVCENALIKNDVGILVNNSRAIIYASNGLDFAQKAGDEAQKVQLEMAMYL